MRRWSLGGRNAGRAVSKPWSPPVAGCAAFRAPLEL